MWPKEAIQTKAIAPYNNRMQLTVKSVTPFACAKAAPLSPAADACRYAAKSL